MRNRIVGPNGNWTESFDEDTVRCLRDMGFIEEDGGPEILGNFWGDTILVDSQIQKWRPKK